MATTDSQTSFKRTLLHVLETLNIWFNCLLAFIKDVLKSNPLPIGEIEDFFTESNFNEEDHHLVMPYSG